MKNILLTNIGNRNIKYKGHYIDLENNDGVNFKEFTKLLYEQLIDDYQGTRSKISLEILPNFVSEIHDIILFATDQDGDLGFQDTLYEARIVKVILEMEEEKNIKIFEYRGNPADEFYAYRYFSNVLREFKAAGKNEYYIVNDAGGTPHMKQALKELCEFFFPDRYKVVYTNQQDQKSDVNRWVKKKYILLNVLAEFVKNYDYGAAVVLANKLNGNLIENDVTPLADELLTYIKIVSCRVNFDRKNAQKPLEDTEVSEKLKENEILSEFIRKQSHIYSGSVNFTQLSEKAKHDIFEIASICQLYFSQHNYTLGTATLYRLMEEFCQSMIETERRYKIETEQQRKLFINNVAVEVKSKFPHLHPSTGLPFMMAYVSLKASDNLQSLFTIFQKLTSHIYKPNSNFKGINILRNNCFLAHDNKPITKEVLDKQFPNLLNGEKWLDQIFFLCDLPKHNIYDQMNSEILKLIYEE